MQEKMEVELAAMRAATDAEMTAQHVMSQFRECQRHPPGPGFRVELLKPRLVEVSRDQDKWLQPKSREAKDPSTYTRLLCLVPGVTGTDWEGGCFPLLVTYSRWDSI